MPLPSSLNIIAADVVKRHDIGNRLALATKWLSFRC